MQVQAIDLGGVSGEGGRHHKLHHSPPAAEQRPSLLLPLLQAASWCARRTPPGWPGAQCLLPSRRASQRGHDLWQPALVGLAQQAVCFINNEKAQMAQGEARGALHVRNQAARSGH